MDFIRRHIRAIALPVAMLFVFVSVPIGAVNASLVTTDEVIGEAAAGEQRAKVETFLQREDVREQFRQMGVDPEEVNARIDTLSDREISRLAAAIDETPAGQGAVGAIVGAVLIIFLVLLITDLLGLTNVFPFVKKQN